MVISLFSILIDYNKINVAAANIVLRGRDPLNQK